jgi:hypothetical protein
MDHTAIRLITWGTINAPLPTLEPSPYSETFEAAYEVFAAARTEYLAKFDAFMSGEYTQSLVGAYRDQLVQQIEDIHDAAMKAARDMALPLMEEELAAARKTIIGSVLAKRQVYSMLDCPDHVVRQMWYNLLDQKCEVMGKFGKYAHSASLFASEVLDNTFKQLHAAVEEVIAKNKAEANSLRQALRSHVVMDGEVDDLVASLHCTWTLEPEGDFVVVVSRPCSESTYAAVRRLAAALKKIEIGGSAGAVEPTPNATTPKNDEPGTS